MSQQVFFSNRKALSPIFAAMTLIAVTVVVSIAVAVWMNALMFTFTTIEKESPIPYKVPEYSNATHVKWWIGNNNIQNVSLTFTPLPTEAWLTKTSSNIWLTVIYYEEIEPNYFLKIAEVTYDIKVAGS